MIVNEQTKRGVRRRGVRLYLYLHLHLHLHLYLYVKHLVSCAKGPRLADPTEDAPR